MLNHLSNSNVTLSMESISEIIDHHTLSRQLVEDTSDIIVQHTLVGHTPSPASSVTPISTHDGIVDEHEVTTSSSVVLNSDSSEHSNVAMAHTIMSHHSPSYQTQRLHHQQHHLLQQQQHQHYQEPSIQHHHHHHQQLSLPHMESPVHFVEAGNTLEALSVGSNCSNTIGHIIAVEQEHKLVIVNGNSDGSSSNNKINNNICNNHKNNNSSINRRSDHNKNNCDLAVVLDDLTTDDHTTLNCTDQPTSVSRDGSRESEPHHTSTLNHIHHQHHQQHCRPNIRGHSPLQSAQSEPITVIVQNQEDSHDSATQILSPPELSVVCVGENSMGTSSYQTLTSVNDQPLSSPGFSPTSAYATLTPLQPLPPISTMSEKFAYGGHISGGGVISNSGANETTSDNGGNVNSSSNESAGVVGTYVVMPTTNQNQHPQHQHTQQHHSNTLSSLSLSGLTGGEPSPYSSYDKLPTMGMSMTPPHNYGSSPSHTLSELVVSCDLPSTSPVGCGPLSPQSPYSHSTALQSPKDTQSSLLHCKDSTLKLNTTLSDNVVTNSVSQQRRIVCLSSVNINGSRIVGDHVAVTNYDSSYNSQKRDLIVSTTPSTSSASNTGGRIAPNFQLKPSSPSSPHSVSASSMNSPDTVTALPHMSSNTSKNLVNASSLQRNHQQHVVSLTPSPPPTPQNLGLNEVPPNLLITANHSHDDTNTLNGRRLVVNGSLDTQLIIQGTLQQHQLHHQDLKSHPITSECSNNVTQQAQIIIEAQQQQQQQQQQTAQKQQIQNDIQPRNKHSITNSNTNSHGTNKGCGDMEEINTKELAQRISAELKRYSIPQAIFAQRVLCRSQGTLSDLLRNPKPWSKLKSGRETFRRMFKWLQEPEFQRMSALRMAAAQLPQRSLCATNDNSSINHHIVNNSAHEDSDLDFRGTSALCSITPVGTATTGPVVTGSGSYFRKDEPQMEHMPQPKKPRLVFTDLQRRTLQAIFKETKRPSKEMQVTIARQLGLEPTTVGNFFMNARRRSMDKWRDDDRSNISRHVDNSKSPSYQLNSSNSHSGQQNHLNDVNSQFTNNNRNNMDNIHIQISSSHHHHHHNHHHQNHHHSSSLDLDDDGDMDLDLVHDDFELSDNNIDDSQHQKDDML